MHLPHRSRLIVFLVLLLIPASLAIALIIQDFMHVSLWMELRRFVASPTDSVEGASSTIRYANATSTSVQTNATVVRHIDGDTIVARLDGEGEWRIRFLGINTPETVDPRKSVECYGKDASHETAQLLWPGERIRLEADPEADEYDKYGRLLRTIFLADGTDVNAFLVRHGFAHAYLSFPLNRQRKSLLKRLQEEARVDGLGLWSKSNCPVQ